MQGRRELSAIGLGRDSEPGGAVLGSVFVVAMFGMLLVPNSIMRSLAVGAILVGIVSVIAALTLLPAVLGLLGDKVNALRIPFVGRRSLERSNPEGRFWGAIVRRVLRRPWLSLALSTGLLIALALPVLTMDIGTTGVSPCPTASPPSRASSRLHAASRGRRPIRRRSSSATSDPGVSRAVDQLRARLAADPRFGRGQIRRSTDGEVALLSVPVKGDAASTQATDAVRELRTEIAPQTLAGTDAEVLVGGNSSEQIDYFDSVIDPAPWVIAFVLLLTFVLLTVVFRSIVVAGTAVALNLLSVGAAYGLLVLVFQEGWGANVFGFERTDAIEAWVPLFLFSVLFGLSMDYQVSCSAGSASAMT